MCGGGGGAAVVVGLGDVNKKRVQTVFWHGGDDASPYVHTEAKYFDLFGVHARRLFNVRGRRRNTLIERVVRDFNYNRRPIVSTEAHARPSGQR